MLKRTIALLLAVLLCVAMAACGSNEEKEDRKEKETPSKASSSDALVSSITTYEKEADGETVTKTEYEYNAEGRPEKLTFYENDEITFVEEYEYDAVKNTQTVTKRDHNGTVKSLYKTEYDDAGNETKVTYYHDDGSYNYEITYTYEYDSGGNILSRIEDDGDGRSYKETYKYDINGRRSMTTYSDMYGEEYRNKPAYADKKIGVWIDRDKSDERVEYTYDDDGNLSSITDYYHGEAAHTETYKYDEYGNISVVFELGRDGDMYSRSVYEY